MTDFTPSKWNGRLRKPTEKLEPFVVLHCTESSSARSTINYFKGMTDRHAGYHTIVDDTGIYHLANALKWRMYGAIDGGNDGIHISGGYRAKYWKGMGKRGAIILLNFAKAIKEVEAQCEIEIPRIYSGDYYGRRAYHAHRKAGTRKGFYFHGDIQTTRTDPGWHANEVAALMKALASLDNPIPKPECEVPPSLKPELGKAVALGITDGSRPGDVPTRAEAAVMAYRASGLKDVIVPPKRDAKGRFTKE